MDKGYLIDGKKRNRLRIKFFAGASIIIVLVMSVFVFIRFFHFEKSNKKENRLYWSNERKLKMSDFVFINRKKTHSKYTAHSWVGIEPDYDIDNETFRYNIHCYLDLDSTWWIFDDSLKFFDTTDAIQRNKNEWILNHEQRHFDIGEVYARKIRSLCLNYSDSKDSSVLDDGIAKLLDSFYKNELTYDAETNHSRNHLMQEAWDLKIQIWLLQLHTYENPEGKAILKYYGKN